MGECQRRQLWWRTSGSSGVRTSITAKCRFDDTSVETRLASIAPGTENATRHSWAGFWSDPQRFMNVGVSMPVGVLKELSTIGKASSWTCRAPATEKASLNADGTIFGCAGMQNTHTHKAATRVRGHVALAQPAARKRRRVPELPRAGNCGCASHQVQAASAPAVPEQESPFRPDQPLRNR